MLTVPQPQSLYRGNYTSFPAMTLKPPVEGNRTIPAEIFWTRDAASPFYTVAFNLRSQQVLSLSQICALHVDNTACSSTVNILFPDTNFQLALDAGMEGFYPVVTGGLEFFAWVSIAPTATEHTVIQILNFLPPPMEFGQGAGTGGGGVGTVRTVATGTGLTGGPITDTGTISLLSPVAIANGGTAGTTPASALDNLSGASGATSGSLTRSAGGVWTVNPAGTGSVTNVATGTGLTGGPVTTTGTISLVVPVSIANGGTGASTAGAAVTSLGAAPLNNAGLTGAPTAPTAPPGTNTTQLATTAYVQNALGSAGFGTISAVVAGTGLSGGGTSGSVTVNLASPVSVANGGTGGATAATARTNLGAANVAGDTFTGNVAIQPSPGSDALLALRKGAGGQSSFLLGQVGTSNRWALYLGEQTAESGANAGSNFSINSYTDAGAFLATPFQIARNSGRAVFTTNGTVSAIIGDPTSTNPSHLLQGAAGNATGVPLQVNSVAGWGGNDHLQVATQGTRKGGYTNSVQCFGTGPYIDIASFAENKSEIRALDAGALALVMRLKPVAYHHDELGLDQHGFLIDDLVNDYPETVSPGYDGNPQGYQPTVIIAALTAAVQTLTARLEAAEATLAALRAV